MKKTLISSCLIVLLVALTGMILSAPLGILNPAIRNTTHTQDPNCRVTQKLCMRSTLININQGHPILSQISTQEYIERQRSINIHGNADFLSQASNESWHGTGTSDDPIIITGYNITCLFARLYIKDTDLYFQVKNNLIDGVNRGRCAIILFNVTHGTFINNIICNSGSAIHVGGGTTNNTFVGNVLYNSFGGMWLEPSAHNNTVYNNFSYNNTYDGIWCESSNNRIYNNTLYDNNDMGIWLDSGSNNLIFNNTIYGNGYGMLVWNTSNNVIASNTFTNNSNRGSTIFTNISNRGIWVLNATKNTFVGNNILNSDYGIFLNRSESNIFSNNTISGSTNYSVSITSSSRNNVLMWNDFITGRDNSSQAYDAGSNNTFTSNYWSDWISPDVDVNGIVDDAYPIAGSASNMDPYPRVKPNISINRSKATPFAGLFTIFFTLGVIALIIRKRKMAY